MTLIVPTTRLLTEEARDALPATVPFADAVFNVAHAGVCWSRRSPTIRPCSVLAMHDRLHEQVRLALVPEVRELFDELQRRDIPVCVSGAGPTLLAFPRAVRGDRAARGGHLPGGRQRDRAIEVLDG